jgi:uncharacterized protein YkwD
MRRWLRAPGWRVATLLLATGMSMAACSGSSPVSPTTPTESAAPDGSPGSSSLEDQVLVLVNQRRASGATCGGTAHPAVAPLTLNLQLRDAARGHSQDMAANNYFSHTSLDGRTLAQRIGQAGYAGGFPLAENIAAGPSTAQAVVDGWMQSTGHCENIMNSGLRVIGIGYAFNQSSTYRHYWTQNFGGG